MRRGYSTGKEDWYDDQLDWPGCRRKAALLLAIGLGILGIAARYQSSRVIRQAP